MIFTNNGFYLNVIAVLVIALLSKVSMGSNDAPDKHEDLKNQMAFISAHVQTHVLCEQLMRSTAKPRPPLPAHEKKLEIVFNMFANEMMGFFYLKYLSDGTMMDIAGDPQLLEEFKKQYELQFGKPFDFDEQIYRRYHDYMEPAHYHQKKPETANLTVSQGLENISFDTPTATYFLNFFRDRAPRFEENQN
jgi:hypothetical protein